MRKWFFTLLITCLNFNTATLETVPMYCIDLPEIVVVSTHKKPKHVREFINSTYNLADSIGVIYSIPTQVILGLACLEGNYGRSKWVKVNNNHFGIAQGKKHFKNKTACFHYLGNLLSNTKRYKPLVGVTNIERYCILLRETGYNSEEGYPKQLYSMVQYLSPLLKNR